MAKKQNQTPVVRSEEQTAQLRSEMQAAFREKYTGELAGAREDVAQLFDSLEAELCRLRDAVCPRGEEHAKNLYQNLSLRDLDILTDDLRRSLQVAARAERGLNALEQW